MSSLDEIEKLHNLYSSGHLTFEEFEREKKKLLRQQNNSNDSNITSQTNDFLTQIGLLFEKFNKSDTKSKRKVYIIGGLILFLILIAGINKKRKREIAQLYNKNEIQQNSQIEINSGELKTKCDKNLILLNDLCWDNVVQARNFNSAQKWCISKGMRLPTLNELVKSSKMKSLMYPDDLAYYSDSSDIVDMSLGFTGNADRTDAYNVRCVIELGYKPNTYPIKKEEYIGEINLDLGFQSSNLGGSGGQMVQLTKYLKKHPKAGIIRITYKTTYGTKQIIYSRFDKTLIRISYDSNLPSTTEQWSNITDRDIFNSTETDSYPNNGTYKYSR